MIMTMTCQVQHVIKTSPPTSIMKMTREVFQTLLMKSLNWTSGHTTLVVDCISVRNVRQCLKVRGVCFITKEPSMMVLCIHVTSVSVMQIDRQLSFKPKKERRG
jgi:hypothetical protein